jgi:hypothetical protein
LTEEYLIAYTLAENLRKVKMRKNKNPPLAGRIFKMLLARKTSIFIAVKAINWTVATWLKWQLGDGCATFGTFQVNIKHLTRTSTETTTIVISLWASLSQTI